VIRVLSLGAGVQSTTMALMAEHGEIKRPNCAIFADTGWEPKAIYAHLDWLEGQLSYPVMRVKRGDLRADTIAATNSTGGKFAAIPWHTKADNGSRSMGRRQCTSEYKINPIQRAVRWLLGGKATPGGCEMLIGISTDEATRMKPSRVRYIVNSYPLIDLRMSRNDCLWWMEKHGYPKPAKSSCLGCPFHSDSEWRAIRNNPDEWADTIAIDKAIRKQPKFQAEQFMHRSCVPLDEVDFSTLEDLGQMNMFENECEGMCGV
jgi:hypothetical protein